MASDNQQCSDPNKHGPHTWYSPSGSGTTQDEHHCPGADPAD